MAVPTGAILPLYRPPILLLCVPYPLATRAHENQVRHEHTPRPSSTRFVLLYEGEPVSAVVMGRTWITLESRATT
jgi:hypothetical protein